MTSATPSSTASTILPTRPVEVRVVDAMLPTPELQSTSAPKPFVAHPLVWLCGFVIACGWDRAVWVWAAAHTQPTAKAWEAAGMWSSGWAALYHAVKYCGTIWVPAALAATIILRSFVQPDTERVKRAIRKGTLIFLCPLAAGLAAEALKLTFRRQRPEMSDGFYSFRFEHFWSTSGLGLPSSHAAPATALAVALIVVWPRYWAWFAGAAVLCCVSRALVGAHYLSDVYGGVFVGLVAARLMVAWDLKNNRGVRVAERAIA